MELLSQNSQNVFPVKLEPRSVMIVLGKPNLCSMSHKKSIALSEVSLTIGLYSIHFVNLSIATKTCVNPLGAVVRGPIMSSPQHANGHEAVIVIN